MQADDYLDFVVGANGDRGKHSTRLSATMETSAVSLAAHFGGLGGLAMPRRKG
ncbi:hypothetical protein [Actibacterium sp. 188UL27-1]|uniref:hypothetical protein n=1 Tax=Actibacterium sp. 188UL27-1 TaxID=2786961 RepID=UPI00195D3235|nr:hypothetical protein [Actibacterium sp. 188UL27-1]MBM7066566.1 hypothetical protein [Actibacterium sp. 188UL27-1]